MLAFAFHHQEATREAYAGILLDERYRYYFANCFYPLTLEFKTDTWNEQQMVSLHPETGQVLGYMWASFDRETQSVNGLGVINFATAGHLIFGRDFCAFLDGLFTVQGCHKAKWTATVGNPACRLYDKIIRRYGGRIVGYLRDEVRMIDGRLHDSVIYEVMRSDYERARAGQQPVEA